MSTCDLTDKNCKPCEGSVAPYTKDEITTMLPKLHSWHLSEDNKAISKQFKFKDFYKTMAFVNVVAWIANAEGHHPDLKVGYDYCDILYTTHAIDGLSENDFICAAKIDAL
jgi:4a-hydroxytetrahydrobiopterin dehydratase